MNLVRRETLYHKFCGLFISTALAFVVGLGRLMGSLHVLLSHSRVAKTCDLRAENSQKPLSLGHKVYHLKG